MYWQAGAAGFYREFPCGAEDAGDTREFIQVVLLGAGCAVMAREFPNCAGRHLLSAPAAVTQHQIGTQHGWEHKGIGDVDIWVLGTGLWVRGT